MVSASTKTVDLFPWPFDGVPMSSDPGTIEAVIEYSVLAIVILGCNG